MKTLTLENILEIHVLVIEATGGAAGIRDLNRIEASVASQTQDVFGRELYPTIHEKAAALIRGLIGDHAFMDGNKRTGMLTGLTLVAMNGLQFEAHLGEIENFAVSVATDHLSVDAIASWLRAHSG